MVSNSAPKSFERKEQVEGFSDFIALLLGKVGKQQQPDSEAQDRGTFRQELQG